MPSSQDATNQITDYPKRHIRVLGPPGSGKTRHVIERYRALSGQEQATTFIVTFSRDQYNAVMDAVIRSGTATSGVSPVFTYFTLAREVIVASGRRFPHVTSELEETMLVRRALTDNLRRLRSPYVRISDSSALCRELLGVFHLLLQHDVRGESLERVAAAAKDARLTDIFFLYGKFLDQLDSHGWITYYDVSHRAAEACTALDPSHPLRAADVLLIDDFQDIDAGQYRLLTTLAPADGNTAVNVFGDPLGALFGFRGTDARYLLKTFPDEYPCETRTLKATTADDDLLQPTLTRLAEEIMEGDVGPYTRRDVGRRPQTTSGGEEWGPLFETSAKGAVSLEVARDEIEEVYGAAAWIHDLIASGARTPDQIAVVTNDKRRYRLLVRTAFAQHGVPVDTGHAKQSVLREFVRVLLQLIEMPRDGVALQTLLTSPFYPFFRCECLGLPARSGHEADQHAEVSRQIEKAAAGLPKDWRKRISELVAQWIRPACEPYQRERGDESIYGFLSALSAGWEDYIDAVEKSGHQPSLVDFIRVSDLFSTEGAGTMPSIGEVGLYSCRETKGRRFDAVAVLGCSELLFPSALRRDSILPLASLQALLDREAPEKQAKIYGARSALDHLRGEYHLMFHTLTRALGTVRLSAPQQFGGQEYPAPSAILLETLPQRVIAEASPATMTPPQIAFARMWVRRPKGDGLGERLRDISPFGYLWNQEAPEVRPFAIARFPISKSSLERYVKCPRLFFYERALRIPQEESHALLVGNLFHGAMARLTEPYQTTHELCNRVTDEAIDEAIRAEIDDDGGRKKKVPSGSFLSTSLRFHLHGMVKKTLRLEGALEDRAIEGVERAFDFEKDGWSFRGKFDRIDKAGGRASVLDYKTGEFRKKGVTTRDRTLDALERPERANWQVPIYVAAYRDAFGPLDTFQHIVQAPGENPYPVTLFIRDDIADVPRAAQSNKRDHQPYSYLLEGEIDAIIDRALAFAGEIFDERAAFEKTRHLSECRTCAFNRLCDRRVE